MLVDISSRRTQLQDGTQLRERQTEIKKGQGPQCPALCYLLSPGERARQVLRLPLPWHIVRRADGMSRTEGSVVRVSGVIWLQTSLGLTTPPLALDRVFSPW